MSFLITDKLYLFKRRHVVQRNSLQIFQYNHNSYSKSNKEYIYILLTKITY